jgi:arylsulfatase A-like enzyme
VHAFTGFDGYTRAEDVNVWDMHGVGGPATGIFSRSTYGLPFVLPRFDQAVAALLEDLEQRGLLANTLVVAVGEFGRTPRTSGSGRDHYPSCYSGMLAGAGIRGGAIYGASDKIAAFPCECPVSPEDFAATVYHALGIAPETRLSPDGFTRPASTGRPILPLFC